VSTSAYVDKNKRNVMKLQINDSERERESGGKVVDSDSFKPPKTPNP
jgi:hypothetical protein